MARRVARATEHGGGRPAPGHGTDRHHSDDRSPVNAGDHMTIVGPAVTRASRGLVVLGVLEARLARRRWPRSEDVDRAMYSARCARVSRSIASVTSSRSGLRSRTSRIPAISRARYSASASARAFISRSRSISALVPVGLAVLREQDHRRGVRGLGREREVQQDERVRVPAERRAIPLSMIQTHHEDRLRGQVPPGPEEAGHPLGKPGERVRVVRRTARGAARGAEVVVARHQRLARATRQSAGSIRSSTSSIVTAPTSRLAASVTGIATTS